MQEVHRYGWVITILVLGGLFAGYVLTRPEPTAERLRYREDPAALDVTPAPPQSPDAIRGRTYVSAYSHAYVGDGHPVLFAVTLSVRNVDPQRSLVVRRIDYHATAGERLRAMLPEARTIPPLGTTEVFVDRSDEGGGSGANFVVEWEIEPGAHRPLVEAVHLGSAGAVGYSFTTVGVDASDAVGAAAVEEGSSGGEAAREPAPSEPAPSEPTTDEPAPHEPTPHEPAPTAP